MLVTTINKLRQEAISKAEEYSALCDNLSEEVLQENVFCKITSAGAMILLILKLLLIAAVMVVGIPMCDMLSSAANSISLPIPKSILILLYYGVCLLFLCKNGFALYKGIRQGAAKIKNKKLKRLAVEILREKDQLDKYEEQIRLAVEKGEDMSILPGGYWQTEMESIHRDHMERQKNDGKKYKILCLVAVGLTLAFCVIGFYPFITGGLSHAYGEGSGMVVALCYMIMLQVMVECLLRLQRWYPKWYKLGAVAGFVVYQLLVTLKLLSNGIFENVSIAIASKDAGDIIKGVVFNYPIVSLVMMTVMALVLILKPRYEDVDYRRTNGFWMRTTGATQVFIESKVASRILRRKMIPRTIAVLLIGGWMSGIINKGWSFGGVLLYVVIAGFLFWFMSGMEGDHSCLTTNGYITVYMWTLLYLSYIIVVLSRVPEFGIGTVVLLLIHFCAKLGGMADTDAILKATHVEEDAAGEVVGEYIDDNLGG